MKATGIVRRVDDLGRIVIPKEIRRTLRIREGDPLLKTLTVSEKYLWAMGILAKHVGCSWRFRKNKNFTVLKAQMLHILF